MSATFLDDEARATFERTIRTIESASAVEVVVAVRRRSHTYRHANVIVGALFAFVGLAIMLFADWTFSLPNILFEPFVVGAALGALVELLPDVKRLLTLPARRREHVARAARATFVERRVHATESRAGLLVYISWLEQQVILVPDVAAAAAIAPELIVQLERDMSAAMRHGGAHVAELLAKRSADFAAVMPRRHDDRNELPDEIHSDLVKREEPS